MNIIDDRVETDSPCCGEGWGYVNKQGHGYCALCEWEWCE